MTKLEILKSIDKAFTSEVLNKFYSVDITSHERARLQGCYRPQIMIDINKSLGLDMRDWEVTPSGYIVLELDQTDKKIFNINGTPIDIRIVLTD